MCAPGVAMCLVCVVAFGLVGPAMEVGGRMLGQASALVLHLRHQ